MKTKTIFLISMLILAFACKDEIEFNDPKDKTDTGKTVNTNPFMLTLNNSSLNNTNGPGMAYDSTGEMRILEESLPEGFESSIDTAMVLSVDLDTTGLLRKVSGFEKDGDEFVIKTDQAEMGDVFLNAEFTLSTEEMSDANLKSGMTNEEMSRALTDEKGYIHPARIIVHTPQGPIYKSALNGYESQAVNDFILNYSDTIFKREHIKVWVDAYLKAYSNFILSFNYQNGYIEWVHWWQPVYHAGVLKYFGAYYNGGIETRANVTALADYEIGYDSTFKLKNDLFKISYKFFVGAVPVFIDVTCDIYGKVSCKLSGELKATSGFSASANAKLGVEYNNGRMGPIKEFSATKTINPLTVEGSVSFEGRAELYPQFMVSIYGAGGPLIELIPYISTNANASASYSVGDGSLDAAWDATVDWGVDARVGAKLEILGKTLAEYKSGEINIVQPQNIWSVPASIDIVSGNNQTGSANNALSNPIIIIVRDSWNNPFGAIPVVFSTEENNGSLDADLKLTSLDGKTSNVWTLGPAGTNTCKALIKKADGTPIDSVMFTAQASK
jgi:hypothetical protein